MLLSPKGPCNELRYAICTQIAGRHRPRARWRGGNTRHPRPSARSTTAQRLLQLQLQHPVQRTLGRFDEPRAGQPEPAPPRASEGAKPCVRRSGNTESQSKHDRGSSHASFSSRSSTVPHRSPIETDPLFRHRTLQSFVSSHLEPKLLCTIT